jgi:exopolysaccharide biosynthesis polyprenyl glycosylphosphotransferase
LRAELTPGIELWLFFPIAFLNVSLARMSVRGVLRLLRSRGYNQRFYLIAGSGKRAQEIGEEISRQASWGIQVIGYLDNDVGLDHQLRRTQVIAGLDQLDRILESHVVDGIFLVAAELPIEALRHALESCRRFGVQAFVDLHPFEDLCGHLSVSQFAHSPLLTIAHTNLGEHHAFLKRVFDLSVSLLALIFLAPLFLLIAWLIKICSPGPVFFRQTRVGRNGRTFTMLKFRSMVVGAEHRHGELAVNNEMTGPVFKMRHDPRIYPFGRYLRMWSLDELPQLWNVLRGEMSLVGPRPPLPREVGQYESWQRRRLSVRPGLTCLWQVKGRNRIDFDDWMRLDLEYIDRWSWWLDMKILFLTLPAMLRGQ